MSTSLSSSLLPSSAMMPSSAAALAASSALSNSSSSSTALLPLRILVQSDMIGAIIGKSGGTIKQITQQTKAKIDVHREETEGLDHIEKIITISGSSEACSRACSKILRIIENEKLHLASLSQQQTSTTTQLNSNPIKLASAPLLNNNNNLTNNNSQLYQLQQDNNPSNAKKQQQQIAGGTDNTDNNITTWDQLDEHLSQAEIQLKILAHNNLIGRLIGRSGNSIKKIMEDTGTKINISSNSLTDCTQERTITVLGNYENVLQAEQVISSKLRAAYSSDLNINSQTLGYHPHQPYLLNNVNPMSYMARQGPSAAGPFNQPRPKKPILATLAATGAPGAGPSAGPPGYGNPLATRPTGSGPYGPLAGSYPNHHPHHHNSNAYIPFYPHGVTNAAAAAAAAAATALGGAAIGPSSVLGGFNSFMAGSESSDQVTVYMYVPIGAVGAIIGRSGSAIKEMISTSGASIKVSSMPISSASVNNNNSNQPSFENTQTKNNIDALSSSNKVTINTNSNTDKNISQTINNLPSENIINNSNAGNLHHQTEVQNSQSSNSTTLISHNQNRDDHNNPTSDLISSTMNTNNNNNNIIKGNTSNDQNQQSSVIPQYRKVTIVGTPEAQWSAQFMIYKKVASESSKTDISLMLEIQIPTSQVGKVIGKAGSTIKQIQKQTRTTVRLLDDKTASPQIVTQPPTPSPKGVDQEPETTVQITGEFHNTQMAQWQIRNLC